MTQTLSPFVGQERIAFVNGLETIYQQTLDTKQPQWVSIEAPPGWGKTRAVRELYARIAATQPEPQYWPPAIEATDRKVLQPLLERQGGSLPSFLWWGIACSLRNGLPSEALRQDLHKLSRHGLYIAAAIQTQQSFTTKHRNKVGKVAAAFSEEVALAISEQGFIDLAGIVIPGFGVFARFARWSFNTLKTNRRTNEAINSPTLIGDTPPDDDLDEIVNLLSLYASTGLGLVLFIEDLHDADELLIKLADQLLARQGPILVITTTWPETPGTINRLTELEQRHQPVRVTHTQPLPDQFPTGATFNKLDTDALHAIIRHRYPDTTTNTLDLLTERYDNPHALEAVCALPKIVNKFADGALDLTAEEIRRLPTGITELYRLWWSQLPTPVRVQHAVSAMITPTAINPDHAAGVRRWHHNIAADIVATLGLPTATDLSDALTAEPHGYAWVRLVDELLREFNEPNQHQLITSEGPDVLGEHLFGDARHDVLQAFATKLLDNPVLVEGHTEIARAVLALHAEGFITDNSLAAESILVLLQALSDVPHELLERRRLFDLFQTLNDDPTTETALSVRHYGAAAAGQKGDITEALTLYQQLLPDFERVLGDDHPDTLTTRSNIASCTGEKGDLDGALALFQQLLPDFERVLGDDHPGTLTTRSNIAYWTGRKGDLDGALTLFQQLLPDQTRVLGDDHPDTLTTRSNIAFSTGRKGDIDGALTLFRQPLPDQTRILGEDHPDTLTTRSNIAFSTGQKGDIDGALALFQQLLPDRQRVLGDDHPDTLGTRNNIAYWTGQKGDIDGALTLFQQLLPDQTRVLGDDHPQTLGTRNNIAHWTGQKGDIDDALTLFQQLLPDQTRVLGDDHPDTLTTRNNIASFTGEKGDIDGALALFQQLLPDRQRVLGDDHPDTLGTRNNIAYWTGEKGDIDNALTLFQQLLPDQTRVLGDDHPDTLTTRNNIASFTGLKGDIDGALTLFRQLLPDQTRVLGKDHPDTLRTRSNIAFLTGEKGDIDGALALFQQLLPDRQRVLGKDHPQTLTTRSNIAYLQAKLDED